MKHTQEEYLFKKRTVKQSKSKSKAKQSNALKEKVMFRETFYKHPHKIPTHTSLFKPSTTKKKQLKKNQRKINR
jgi:hypothetical protein